MNTYLIEQIAAYGNNRLATDLGVSPQAVSKWSKRGELPPRRVLAVARMLSLPPEKLAPDLFGEEADAGAARFAPAASQARTPLPPTPT